MRLYRSHRELGTPPREAVVTLGNFDGVHVGHQTLMRRIRERAAARGGESVAFTFRPHPVKVLAPHLAPPLITTYDRKLALLGDTGVDVVVEEPFDETLAALTPREFVEEVLVRSLGAREIVIGYDFTFGKGRAGTVETLRALGPELGFTVQVEAPVSVEGLVASSTKVRELVLEGRVSGAARLLGRQHALFGTVVKGQARGRTIGIPTANLATTCELTPKPGVYATRALLPGAGEPPAGRPAVSNVGHAPTFAGKELTVETHLLDYDGDLYGRALEVRFVERLREERRFSGVDALVAQIHQDIAGARALLYP